MFKRINKHAITEALQSDKAMEREIKECHQYRKAYGFCLIALAIPLLLILFFKEAPDLRILFTLFILFVSNALAAASNHSRLELLEAISELKHLSQPDKSSP